MLLQKWLHRSKCSIEEVEKEIEEVKRTTPNDREMLLALRKYLAELQEEKK